MVVTPIEHVIVLPAASANVSVVVPALCAVTVTLDPAITAVATEVALSPTAIVPPKPGSESGIVVVCAAAVNCTDDAHVPVLAPVGVPAVIGPGIANVTGSVSCVPSTSLTVTLHALAKPPGAVDPIFSVALLPLPETDELFTSAQVVDAA